MKRNAFGFNPEQSTIVPDGRIAGRVNDQYEVITETGVVLAQGKGNLGDFVSLVNEDGEWVIKSQLNATTTLKTDAKMVTNFDAIILVGDVKDSNLLEQLEHHLNRVWDTGVFPSIVLVNETNQPFQTILYEVRQIAAFVDVFVLENDWDQVRSLMKQGETTLLLGGSQKAKEYLLNQLFQVSIDCENYSLQTHDSHFWLILNDSYDNQTQSNVFEHIEALMRQCRFSDCTHTNEPGCQIIEALESGKLSSFDYEKYIESKDDEIIDEYDDRPYYQKKERIKQKFTKKNGKIKDEQFIY